MLSGKVLLVANPAAQSGAGAQAARRVEGLLRERLGGDLAVALTERAGHAADIAADAGAFDAVVALGGDGVVNEVVNGLVRIPADDRPAFGVVPVGSGNDYAFSLGMAPSLEAAVVQLFASPLRAADVGACNGRCYAETLSFGLDAAIALDTVERRQRTGASGTKLYLQSGIDQLLHHLDAHAVRASFDGATARQLSTVTFAVQMGPTYGGGFRICPDARFDDGTLDVCLAHAPVGVLKAVYVFLKAKSGAHTGFREIELLRARAVRLEFAAPVPAQIDGERIEALSFDISVIPDALRVLAPSAAAFSRPPLAG